VKITSELASHVPLAVPGTLERHATVVVYLEHLTVGGPYAVVVAVAALPPPVSPERGTPKPIVRPSGQDLLHDMPFFVKTEGNGKTRLPVQGHFNLFAEKSPWHRQPPDLFHPGTLQIVRRPQL